MEREQKQTEHVKPRHKIILEAIDHHRIDIVMAKRVRLEQRKTRIGFAESKMREVISDKREHDQSAHHHVTRGKRCFDVTLVDVRLRSGAPVFNCQLDRHVDVNDDGGEQKNSYQPKQRAEIVQMLRVTVDPIRADENLQIPEQMSDHEKDQNDAGDRDDDFFSDRRAIKMG